jgi:exonuclease III
MTRRQATLTNYWSTTRRSLFQQNFCSDHDNNMTTSQTYNHSQTTLRPAPASAPDATVQVRASGQVKASHKYAQSTLSGNINNQFTNDMAWGDTLERKETGTLRFAFRNVNSLPAFAAHSKNDELIQDIRKAQLDIFGMSEININWSRIQACDQLRERFRGCFEAIHLCTSHNLRSDSQDKRQIGGTCMFTNDKTCYRIITSGSDDSKMGRWSWLLLRGQNGVRVRVVTLYRPVQSFGATSTYQQHQQLLLDANIDECPRKQMMYDLRKFLSTSIESGDKIIVMGDFNEDVRSHFISRFFDSLGMHESIIGKHGENAPNTFYQGTVPIDGIFMTKNLIATRSGYTQTSWGMPSDHRLLWIDIRLSDMLGEHAPIT